MSTSPDPNESSDLFRRLAARDPTALGEIATHIWTRLRSIARRRLDRAPELRGIYEEEDAMQSGFEHIWQGILAGILTPPDGTDSFLRLARTIIARRIVARARGERAAKRNPTPYDEPVWSVGPLYDDVPDDLNVFAGGSSRPEAGLIARDETQWLLSLLGPALRNVAQWRLQGLTVAEIARDKGRSPRTIARSLQEIRAIWHDAQRDRDP